MHKALFDQITAYLQDKKEEMITTLEEIVRIESFSREPEAVERVAMRFKGLFEVEGVKCKLLPCPPNGPTLVGILGEDREKEPIVFSGHMDTVFKHGSISPLFRIEGGKAYGPGVLDMKGGIVITLYIIKALNHIGYKERPIKIAFSGDEEICHKGSESAIFLKEAATGAKCAFNMETGLVDNSLCYGRKGRVEATVTVQGKSSHAGNDFESGINAINEMAEKIVRLYKLTDLEKGTTVTCALVNGGTAINAIPEDCVLSVECRFEFAEEMERFQRELESICNHAYIEGTSTELTYESLMPPFECTERIMNFFHFVKETAIKYGLEDVKGKKLGGGSDASHIGNTGTPVLCSMGIQGEWNHTAREYAIPDSMVSRGRLISAVILELEQMV